MIHAVLLNSLMIRALDFNDIYLEEEPFPLRDDSVRIPERSGKEFITTMVLLYARL